MLLAIGGHGLVLRSLTPEDIPPARDPHRGARAAGSGRQWLRGNADWGITYFAALASMTRGEHLHRQRAARST